MPTLTLADGYQPWLAASPDDLRPALGMVYFDPARVAVATDTHCLAVCPYVCDDAAFAGALIPADFLARAYKDRPKGFDLALSLRDGPDGPTVTALSKAGGTLSSPVRNDLTFPAWRRVLPATLTAAQPAPAPSALPLAIDGDLLSRAARAVGLDLKTEIALYRAADCEYGAFLLPGIAGAFAVVMPLHLGDRTQARLEGCRALWQRLAGGAAPVEPAETTDAAPPVVQEKPEPKKPRARPLAPAAPVPPVEASPPSVVEPLPPPVAPVPPVPSQVRYTHHDGRTGTGSGCGDALLAALGQAEAAPLAADCAPIVWPAALPGSPALYHRQDGALVGMFRKLA